MSSDIELVQSSFEKVVPIADQAADLFYNRLFEIAPDVKPLFGESDMKAQGKKLMATLGVAVRGLSDLEATVPVIQKLAQNHVQYGVRPEHYEPVGEALIWTLGQGLGEGFTPEVKTAWVGVYTLVSETMIAAAYDGEAA